MRTAPPFVGRVQERVLIERWLEESTAGHPRVVLVQGEAGIGKTRLLHEARSRTFLIPRVLANIAVASGQTDAAAGWFQSAIDVAFRIGTRTELGRACLDYARMLTAMGGRSDRAIELVQQGAAIFLQLGMAPFAEQRARLAEVLQVRISAAPARRPVYPDGLSEREVEVLIGMTQGRSRQEIAGELVVAQQTIGAHVTSILGKIRARDEVAAAAYAREQGRRRAHRPRRARSGRDRASRNGLVVLSRACG